MSMNTESKIMIKFRTKPKKAIRYMYNGNSCGNGVPGVYRVTGIKFVSLF